MTRPLRVFLCHASQDKPTVRKLHRYLKQHGIEPWLDEIDLLPGENWEVEIPKALNASDVILVCLSKNSINKEGYVQKEISFALDKALEKPDGTIFIIPAKLEECEVPKRLNRYQWVDLFRPDSNKRMLLGLNKRALSLGSDVSPVMLDDTRQKKSASTKPVVDSDQLNRDAVEKASREKMDREKVEAARLTQEAKERSDREWAEKAAIQKLELEQEELSSKFLADQTARNKAAKELEEQADRKAEEKAVVEKLELETEQLDHKYLVEKKIRSKTILRFLGIGGIVLFALIFGGFGLNYLINNPPIATATISSPKATATIKLPTLTSVPFTPTHQPTETLTPVPTLGIGSTMIGEQGEILVYVPAGEFTMGSDTTDTGASDEQPIHTVFLDAFWIDQTEVTNKEYEACVDGGICEPPSSTSSYTHPNYYGNPEFDNYPVIYVNWDKANRYCRVWKGTGGSLPTEAQWEKAARGADARIYPWGNDAPHKDLLNYSGNIGDTTEVKNYPNTESFYGTYDMAGNVWEWVNDWYRDDYYNGSITTNNPLGPKSGQYRVLRGGAWGESDYFVRSAIRYKIDPSYWDGNFGFRCSRSP